MTATLDSARGAITALEASAGVWLAFDGKRMVLRDSSTEPAPRRGAAKRR
jgi:hypothetical protein